MCLNSLAQDQPQISDQSQGLPHSENQPSSPANPQGQIKSLNHPDNQAYTLEQAYAHGYAQGRAWRRVRQRKPFESYHNITFGVGGFPMMGGAKSRFVKYDPYGGYNHYDQSRRYQNNAINLPAFNLGYSYDLLRWLSLGGTLSYSYSGAKYYDGFSDEHIGSFGTSNLSLSAMVRFTWLRRSVVRLYSQVGLGLGLCIQNKALLGDRYDNNLSVIVAGQMTYFGIQIGRKVYGYAELAGFGTQGALVVGIGCRFMNKKR